MKRVALMHATYWPEVRRGSERLIHDLGAGLAARGHRVTLITSHGGPTTSSVEDGIEVIRNRRPPRVRPLQWYEDHVTAIPMAGYRLWRGDFDVAHAFFAADAWAARQVRRYAGGPPFIFSVHGIPNRPYLVERRHRLAMYQSLVADAAETTVLSRAAAQSVHRYFLREPVIVPGGVVYDDFDVVPRHRVPPLAGPRIVCAASIHDPRKRAEVLFEAFEILRQAHPGAELKVVRTSDPFGGRYEGRKLPRGVRLVDAPITAELAQLYADADISVLPALHEAFGLVLVESLAAGTPVVAARSGAGPEIVTHDEVGRLFEPDDPVDLARAMNTVVAMSRRSPDSTRAACKARARDFDISKTIDSFEQLYEKAAPVGRW